MIEKRKVIELRVVIGADNTPEDIATIREQVFNAVANCCYDTLDSRLRDMTDEEYAEYGSIYGDDFSDSELIKDSYEGGVCPDCQENIPDDVMEGQECDNCGHVFYAQIKPYRE